MECFSLQYDLASVKVEEEKVEFYVADPYSCKDCNFTYDGLASYKMHREIEHGESNAAFSFVKGLEEMNLKFQRRVPQLDQATDVPSEGGAQIKIENEFSQNEIELNEAESDFSIGNSKYDLASVKVEEEKVEFHVADPYSCKDCNFTYDGLASYKTHRETIHGDLSDNSSISDSGVFRDNTKLNEPRTRAGKCDNEFTTEDKPFKCNVCSSRFTRMSYLKQHVRIHTGERPFGCELCSRKFRRKGDLTHHALTHTEEKPVRCEICNRKFLCMTNLKKHVVIHAEEKPFKCNICNSTFTHKSHLKKHVVNHTGEKPFKCEICNRKFTRKGDLKLHSMTHTGGQPFKCEICNCKFTRTGDLKLHSMTHTGGQPFKCEICNRKFTRKGDLKLHSMTHTEEKPFKCEICNRRFMRKGELKLHSMTHTGGQPFKCEICNSRFTQTRNLKQHMMAHMRRNLSRDM